MERELQALPRQRHDREKGTKPENHSRSAGSVCLWCADAAIAAYPYLGFDAMSTLTEETVEPEKNIPRAIVGIALIGGIISAGGGIVRSRIAKLGRKCVLVFRSEIPHVNER
ncbi:APC family permease [Burkholderia ubonensis]|uniref:Uncharacterized protein n=1 Tax=Burkholderia ubonensis TaxID=101571 RepID=A0A1R1JCN2_9BURK|nr:APC family permease [Burkholderia ubonensis]OMG73063.1 hypothetical protein BW685_12600 [Burkholderia ubonensis]